MSDVLEVAFEVDCSVGHAFHVWTSRLDVWWPRDHTVSGAPDAALVLEPRSGGRIYERTVGGVEHDWGEITTWDPPAGFGYLWHIGRDREVATEVQISFVTIDDRSTRVEITHGGWARLGAQAIDLRRQNQAGWDALIEQFRAAATGGH